MLRTLQQNPNPESIQMHKLAHAYHVMARRTNLHPINLLILSPHRYYHLGLARIGILPPDNRVVFTTRRDRH